MVLNTSGDATSSIYGIPLVFTVIACAVGFKWENLHTLQWNGYFYAALSLLGVGSAFAFAISLASLIETSSINLIFSTLLNMSSLSTLPESTNSSITEFILCSSIPTASKRAIVSFLASTHSSGTRCEYREHLCKFCSKGKEFATATTVCKTCSTGLYQDKDDTKSAACKKCSKVAQYAPIISSPQTSPRKNNALNTPLPLSLSSSASAAAAAAAAAASFYPNDFSTFANESKSHKIRKWVSKSK